MALAGVAGGISAAGLAWRKKALLTDGVNADKLSDNDVVARHNTLLARKYDINMAIFSYTPTKFVLVPGETKFLRYWDLTTIVLLLYTALVTPFEVAYMTVTLNGLFIVNRIVDALFLVDFVVSFFTAYYDDENMRLVMKREKIVKRYLRTWAVIDFLSILPFDALGFLIDSSAIQSLRLVRFLRLLRLMKLLRILRASRIIRRWKTRMGISIAMLHLLKFFSGMMLTAHWSACAWYLVALFEKDTGHDDTWIDREGVDDARIIDQYAISLYWSVMTLSTIGYGDVTPVTVVERMFAICNMIVGGAIYAYMVGAVCSIVLNLDLATAAYNRALDDLNLFMKEINLPPDLRIELREYFEHCKRLQRNRFYANLLTDMSPELRRKVSSYQHEHWISRIPFFKAKDAFERAHFRSALADVLIPMAFAPFEEVMRDDEQIHQMYIIVSGMAITRGRILGVGAMFGEEMILSRQRFTHSVRSLGYLDVFMLSRAKLHEVLDTGEYPATKYLVRWHAIQIALKRMMNRVKTAVHLSNSGKGKEARDLISDLPIAVYNRVRPGPTRSGLRRLHTYASFEVHSRDAVAIAPPKPVSRSMSEEDITASSKLAKPGTHSSSSASIFGSASEDRPSRKSYGIEHTLMGATGLSSAVVKHTALMDDTPTRRLSLVEQRMTTSSEGPASELHAVPVTRAPDRRGSVDRRARGRSSLVFSTWSQHSSGPLAEVPSADEATHGDTDSSIDEDK